MDKVYGLTLLVIGGAFLWGASHVWHALKGKDKDKKGWKELLVLLIILAGVGIGAGLSLLFGLNFFYVKVGIVPLWVILALVTGIWFLVDLAKRHEWTRTTLLGFATALLIAIPAAHPLESAAVHGHQVPHVISVTRKG